MGFNGQGGFGGQSRPGRKIWADVECGGGLTVRLPRTMTDFGTATPVSSRRPAPGEAPAPAAPGRWVVTMPGYLPVPLNALVGRSWRAVHRLKERDRARVAAEVALAGVPAAAGRRRLTVRLVLGPRMRGVDPDAPFKVLLDSLVWCGALRDDSRAWLDLAPAEYERGPRRATVLTLEDVG